MSSVRRDRGAADALALVLIAPAVIGLAVLVVMLGRSVDSRAQAQSAAEAAAQAAALERSPAAADAAARRVAEAMLVDHDSCSTPVGARRHHRVPARRRGARVDSMRTPRRVASRRCSVRARSFAAEAVAHIDEFRAAEGA